MQRTHGSMSAFTLAEMMIVMLIISIVLAAMAPVMTTRNKVDNSSPWHWVTSNPSDAYFGPGQAMRAFIGQSEATQTAAGTDIDFAKLIINTAGSSLSHILFKSNANILGELYMSKDGDHGSSIVLGNRRNPAATIGNENINIGWDNWSNADLTGASNITIGDASMQSLTSGGHNIGLGTTLRAVSTGEHNIGIGDDSMVAITGSGNIGIGGNANAAATSVSKTIAIGSNAVANGNGAIAIGGALTSAENHGGTANAAQARVFKSIAIGSGATSGYESAGNDSIAIGPNANANTTDGSGTRGLAIGFSSTANADNAVSIGSSANSSADSAVSIGSSANSSASNTVSIGKGTTSSASNAIAIGVSSSASAGSGIAIGNTSKASGTSGIAIGDNSSAKIQDIAIGAEAVAHSGVSGTVIAIGYQAMKNSGESGSSIAIGEEALYNNGNITGYVTAGWDNIGIGHRALMNNTTGSSNIAVGTLALRDNEKGSNNIAIGEYACSSVKGSNKTCIGRYSGPGSTSDWASERDDTERIFIGRESNFNGGAAVLEVHNTTSNFYRNKDSSVVINGNLIVKGGIISTLWKKGEREDNINLYGRSGGQLEPVWNDDISSFVNIYSENGHGRFKSFESGHDISDRRLKYVGKENTSGLEKIRQLKVFNYTFKKDTTKEPHVGVIAQDLQKVFPDAVKKGTDGFLRIRMEDMFYAVINAIKELDAKYQAQEKRINDLEKRIEKLEAKSK